jgi:hypothetical protein
MQLVMQRNMISPLLVGNASAQLPRPDAGAAAAGVSATSTSC